MLTFGGEVLPAAPSFPVFSGSPSNLPSLPLIVLRVSFRGQMDLLRNPIVCYYYLLHFHPLHQPASSSLIECGWAFFACLGLRAKSTFGPPYL